MNWLPIVLLGHVANAGAFVIDKILLTKTLKLPSVYVFYIGLLGILSFVLLPFAKFHWLSLALTLECLVVGVSFMLALLCFFSALQRGEASRVVPIVGALIPLWTLGFAAGYLGEGLIGYQGYGIALLILGAVLISYEDGQHPASITAGEVGFAILAAGLFALSYTLTKGVYDSGATTFLNAFLWMRLFSLVAVMPLLLLPKTRQAVFGGNGATERPNPLFFLGQAMGSAGFFLVNIGIKFAPQVSVVNALQGVQYGFLFLLTMLLSWVSPSLIHERLTPRIIVQKSLALVVLVAGLMLATA